MTPIYHKVYILAPYKHHTGGVELAHQLVHKLNKLGQESYVVYIKGNQISDCQDVTTEYMQYIIKSTNLIEDNEKNILILPEIYFDFIHRFRKINIGCWWMSVDNRYKNANLFDVLTSNRPFRSKLSAIKHFRKTLNLISDKQIGIDKDRITHFYQSIYAMHHLYRKGFYKILPLGDYINSNFLSVPNNEIERENVVLYNPAKGYKFTKRIIEQNPDIHFIPLKGYSRAELAEIMRKSKVYIDFGNFPGKDRLSREAVLNGNIVITGLMGASEYYEDVPILNKYKFKINKQSLPKISKCIREAFENFEFIVKDFDYYRKRTEKEESIFNNQIKEYFFR